ncbi:MAG: Smr/MutS family protein [Acidobacteriota bacterium]|nr:Smr/MutS family protein [Acidobacteriota bacterium]
MSRQVDELLEFDELKRIIGLNTTCAPGRRAIESLAFSEDLHDLKAEFALIDEAVDYLRSGSELGFGSLADPQPWLARLAVPGSGLSPEELLQSATLMETAAGLRAIFRSDDGPKYRLLEETATPLADFHSLLSVIRRAVLPNGEISDDASPKLKRIRASTGELRQKIRHSLESILRARNEPGGEDYITLRNERFVIPVRASERRSVPGVVHAASATGQTVFVEPLDTIDLNNRLVQLGDDEAEEVARILDELTSHVREQQEPLARAAKIVTHFDSLFARARFARAYDCVAPEFTAANRLHLQSARNPVLDAKLRREGRRAVPLSVSLGGEGGAAAEYSAAIGTVLVISGPNTGGKTVALKTVGLAALSAQSGIPVAADRAELPIFDRVLADIGDEQSMAADLSTFSAHILNVKSMLETATASSLILMDEMGTGTAPEEGAALAVALLEEFRERRALTLATTHHDRLKAYASTTPGVVNAAMEFDEENLRPTYRLLAGVPGSSSGIEIARRLGLPPRAIERARAGLSPESREARELIAYLHGKREEMDAAQARVDDERNQLETERRALRGEWIERQKKRIADLERSFAEMQQRLQEQIERIASEIKDRAHRAQIEKLAGRRVKRVFSDTRAEADAAIVETLASSQPDLGISEGVSGKSVSPEQLSPSQRILVKGFKQPVVFRKHDGKIAEIEAGPMRMKIPLTEIIDIAADQPSTGGRAAARSDIRVHAKANAAAEEINVIGCTVEEATARVDKFLDEATLAGKPSVRIIHGYGTGALRRGLADFLATHPLVDRIHAEADERGGNAVTVAELQT